MPLLGAFEHLRHGRGLNLLVTDVGLPGLDGRQVAETVRERHPALPGLLITGYAGNAIEDAALAPGMQLLHKPFPFEDFAARVRATLDLSRVD